MRTEDESVYISAVGSAGPFRGRKRSLYEGGIRVPFIVTWGGGTPHPRVAAGTVDNTVLGAVDWLPTVLKLANVSAPSNLSTLDGADMSSAIVRLNSNNETVRPPAPRATPLFWEWRFAVAGNCVNSAPQLAVRDGRFKLLRDLAEPTDGGRLELYALDYWNTSSTGVGGTGHQSPDFFEARNLAALPGAPFQADVDRLSAAVKAWQASLPPGPYLLAQPCSAWPFRGYTSQHILATESWQDSAPDE